MRLPTILIGIAASLALSQAAAAQKPAPAAPAGKISIELNKMEERQGSCRLYFVISNRTARNVRNLELDVFLFDHDDIIAHRVGLNTRRLKRSRMHVRVFDIAKVTCAGIGKLVLNEVLSCTATGGGAAGCEDDLAPSSRARAAFLD